MKGLFSRIPSGTNRPSNHETQDAHSRGEAGGNPERLKTPFSLLTLTLILTLGDTRQDGGERGTTCCVTRTRLGDRIKVLAEENGRGTQGVM